MGSNVCKNILFVHPIFGCDTTSRLFGIEKKAFINKVKDQSSFVQEVQVFTKPKGNPRKVAKAGELALVTLYGGKIGENLDDIRLHKFSEHKFSGTTYSSSKICSSKIP